MAVDSDVLALVGDWVDDYSQFARECVRFKGKDGQIIRHDRPHPGQISLRQPYKRRKTTRVVLKARQVGCTSEIASQFVHQAVFTPGTSILVLAQTMDGVRGISAVYAHVVEHLPSILRCGIFQSEVSLHRIVWPAIQSEIVFSTANTVSVRGTPRQGVHITEAAFVDDLERTLTAIRPTCHGPLVLESTANGPGPFHMAWNDQHLDRIFISWVDDATCTSDEPLPSDLTVQESKYIEDHQLTPGQSSWFVQTLRASNWESFRQEHPITPSEAFVLGGDRFFRNGYFPKDTKNTPPLVIHLEPIRGHRYAIGADPASGSSRPGSDRSACVVLDVTNPFDIKTAASYAHRITPSEFAKVVTKLSKLYFDAVCCVERNAGYGLTVLDAVHKDGVPLYHSSVYDQQTKSYTDRYGWDTTEQSRKLMLSRLQEVVNNGHYVPGDPRIEEEFNAFRYNEDGTRPEAVSGMHDDLVFAAALALAASSQTRDTTLHAPPQPPKPHADEGFQAIATWEMKTGELWEDSESDADD